MMTSEKAHGILMKVTLSCVLIFKYVILMLIKLCCIFSQQSQEEEEEEEEEALEGPFFSLAYLLHLDENLHFFRLKADE